MQSTGKLSARSASDCRAVERPPSSEPAATARAPSASPPPSEPAAMARAPSASPAAMCTLRPASERELQRSYDEVLAIIGNEDDSSGLPVAAPPPPPPVAGEDLSTLYGDDDDQPPAPERPDPDDPAQWDQPPEPGQRPAVARKPSGPAPGFTNAQLAREHNPARIALGISIMAIGGFLLAWYLPARAPLANQAGIAAASAAAWHFSPDLYLRARIASSGFVGVGLLFVFHGVLFRPLVEIVCRRCKRYVIAERDGINLKCPRSSHVAGLCYATIVLMALFLACVGPTLLFIALANVGQTH